MGYDGLSWDDVLDIAWARDERIAARVCDPDDDLSGYLAALWERQRWTEVDEVVGWREPHPAEAEEDTRERWQ